MIDGRHAPTSELAERISLHRSFEGVIQKFRLQHLGERLAADGPLQIVYWYPGFSYDRLRLVMEDRSALKLKLYWPCREALGTLCSVEWRDGDGWQIGVTTVADERLVLRAFAASIPDT